MTEQVRVRGGKLTARGWEKIVRAYFRRQPYTAAGIKRVPCRQCGQPSAHQWDLRPCALGQRAWYGLCREHDIELNQLVVDFLRVPDGTAIMAAYRERTA